MKKSMTDYLYALSENNCDELYEILCHNYRKFIRIYWLLKEFSENIIFLKCKEKTENDKLKISISFSGIKANDVADKLRLSITNSDEIEISTHKDKMEIEIHKKEFEV